ncbi:hypothetical protein M8997_009335 [Phyllobacterium sp. 21LDTY02-6]|uniref:hypothetical protein n=1 Tax=Phyllobacterium sp. 21LDTY02-6 TaxID=2944903 RepID=UPI00202267EC|nr:hypothetical protein [Phyllobacterium sp. 21LDTY02-6]MCO4317383.1 hypothetical protein [Phyllobacterium sp. 21LDTY02-6]
MKGPGPAAAAIIAIGTMLSGPSFAACTQDRAIYADADDRYTLTFQRQAGDSAENLASEFFLKDGESQLQLSGVVMREGAASRPQAALMYDCPSGDATGAELAACTVWQGVIYGLKEGADAELLPRAAEPAAQAVLLPDLAGTAAGFDFKLDKPLGAMPPDVYRFKECGPNSENE